MKKTFGKSFLNLRKALGLSQEKMAEELGCSATTISRWETDTILPAKQTLDRLMTYIESKGLDPYDFYIVDDSSKVDTMLKIKEELEYLINCQSVTALEKKLEEFQTNMDPNSVDDQQYMRFGQLMSLKLSGQQIDDFVSRCQAIYELSGSSIPSLDSMASAPLSNIQQLILIKIGQHYIDTGDLEKGHDIIKRLLLRYGKNPCATCMSKERMLDVSASIAKSFYMQGNYEMSIISCNYIFEKLSQDPVFFCFKEALKLGCKIYLEVGQTDLAKEFSNFVTVCDNFMFHPDQAPTQVSFA